MTSYIHPDVLVDTTWVAAHAGDSSVRVAEVDVDATSYAEGHVPGAIGWDWSTELCDTHLRDILPRDRFEQLMGDAGIEPSTKVVLYGDNNNWFAAWAFWQLKIYGHRDVVLMNGGRRKWLAEQRSLTADVPHYRATQYKVTSMDDTLRAFLPDVQDALRRGDVRLIDVRSPAEFTGEILAPPGLPETCQRGGHIPGAKNVPWGKACSEDGTFLPFEELRRVYANVGVDTTHPAIAYCRIGERSSHTWFVLKYLLGVPDVKNYDGSWTEWGNLVRAPIET